MSKYINQQVTMLFLHERLLSRTVLRRDPAPWRVSALGAQDGFIKEFQALMAGMNTARAASLTPPECFFKKARRKIMDGHYEFSIDSTSQKQ